MYEEHFAGRTRFKIFKKYKLLQSAWDFPGRNAEKLARRMTKKNKERFLKRMENKRRRLEARGARVPEYYVQDENGYHGGKDLALSARYPAAFCNAVFKLWEAATLKNLLQQKR